VRELDLDVALERRTRAAEDLTANAAVVTTSEQRKGAAALEALFRFAVGDPAVIGLEAARAHDGGLHGAFFSKRYDLHGVIRADPGAALEAAARSSGGVAVGCGAGFGCVHVVDGIGGGGSGDAVQIATQDMSS